MFRISRGELGKDVKSSSDKNLSASGQKEFSLAQQIAIDDAFKKNVVYIPIRELNDFIVDNPENELVPVQFSQIVKLMEMQSDLKDVSQSRTLFKSMLKAYLRRKYNIRFTNKQKEEVVNYIF